MADIGSPTGNNPWDEDVVLTSRGERKEEDEDVVLTSHNIEDIFPELGDEDYNENWEKAKTSNRQAVLNISKPNKDETEKQDQIPGKRVRDKIVFDKTSDVNKKPSDVNKKSSVFDRIGRVKSPEETIVSEKQDDISISKKSVFDRIGKAQMQINEISSTEDTGKKRSVFERIGSTGTRENENDDCPQRM